jgi:hypothetical protein
VIAECGSFPLHWMAALIDGNHRAARGLREQRPFFAAVLDRAQTLELLRRSMGTAPANH